MTTQEVSGFDTVGKRVIRTKGSSSQINSKGTIIESGFNGGNGFDPDRFRIRWDHGVRTWVNKNSFSIINDDSMTTQEQEYPFTEGSWKITFSRDGKEALIDNGFIASVNTDDNERGEANAKLIARSKDMFILIRDLVDAMDMAEIPPVNNDLYKRACEILKVGKV